MKFKNQIPYFMEMSQLTKIQLKRNILSHIPTESSLNSFSVSYNVTMCFAQRLVKPGLFTVNYARYPFIILFMFSSLS